MPAASDRAGPFAVREFTELTLWETSPWKRSLSSGIRCISWLGFFVAKARRTSATENDARFLPRAPHALTVPRLSSTLSPTSLAPR